MGILRSALIGTAAYQMGKKSLKSEEKKEGNQSNSTSPQPCYHPEYPPQYQYGQPPYGQNPYGAPQYPQGYGNNYQGYPSQQSTQQYSRGREDFVNNGGPRSMQASAPPYQHNPAFGQSNEKSPVHYQGQGTNSHGRPN